MWTIASLCDHSVLQLAVQVMAIVEFSQCFLSLPEPTVEVFSGDESLRRSFLVNVQCQVLGGPWGQFYPYPLSMDDQEMKSACGVRVTSF